MSLLSTSDSLGVTDGEAARAGTLGLDVAGVDCAGDFTGAGA